MVPALRPSPSNTVATPWWMALGIFSLAFASIGASLAYMWEHERPSGGVVETAAELSHPGRYALSVCANCGLVEAVELVLEQRPAHRGGRLARKAPVYQVRVRMEDGDTRTVPQSAPLAIGARVMLRDGVLRLI